MNDPWILRLVPPVPSARIRLFCISHAGGGASAYSGWLRRFDPEVSVYAVQLPGRENRLKETPYSDLASLIAAAEAALGPYLEDLPFAFFGHSMGALVAFELCRRLRDVGMPPPVRLFVSGFSAPHLNKDEPRFDDLSDRELLREITDHYGGVPVALLADEEAIGLFAPALRADFKILSDYRYLPSYPLPCAISALGGDDDPHAPAAELEAWRTLTDRTFTLRLYPGSHFYLVPNRDRLIADITADLLGADGGPIP